MRLQNLLLLGTSFVAAPVPGLAAPPPHGNLEPHPAHSVSGALSATDPGSHMLAAGLPTPHHGPAAAALAAGAELVTLSAVGDAFSWPGAVMTAGSDTITLASGTGTFAPCDAGTHTAGCTNPPKDICVTGSGTVSGTGMVTAYGPFAPVNTQCGSITSVEGSTSSRVATVSFTAALSTPAYGGNSFTVLSAGSGYVVGDTVTLDVGTLTPYSTPAPSSLPLNAVQRVEQVLAVSGTVSNVGSGSSVTGTCGVIGTLGTVRTGGSGRVQALVTVTGGSIDPSAGVTITQGGDYTQNPASNIESLVPYSSSSNITACTGLTGATLSLSFGVVATTPVRYGYYPSKASVGIQGTQAATSGHGMGVTLTTASSFFSVSGTVALGSGSWTTTVNQVTGSYFSIGPLNCVNFTASFSASSISHGAGPLQFPLPIAALSNPQAIPVSGIQGNIVWPVIGGGTGNVQTTQIQFFPFQNKNYGQVAFAASTANLIEAGSQLAAGQLSTGTTYAVSVNGCYR